MYFEKQKIDEAGEYSVKLQQVIIALFCLNIVQIIFDIIYMATAHAFLWYFVFIILAWLLLLMGFLGAKKRARGSITAYAIIMLIIVLVKAIGWFITFIGVLVVGLFAPVVVLAFFWLGIIFAFVVFILEIISVVYAFRLRRLLTTQVVYVTQPQSTYIPPTYGQPATTYVYVTQPQTPQYVTPAYVPPNYTSNV
eukprot:TRINITY_DN5182_c0_g1_i1.p1 TRINITY_DN5182_c0_g1~~TRINITY_DN5182_c0_g1_i1.p1  ORF type:complete len:195 (+),score=47.11 TRINITY_DN5182_c0_g1_i1:192-776(+)